MDPRAIGLALTAAAVHAAWNLRLHSDTDRVAAVTVAMFTGGVVLLPALILAFPAQVIGLAVASALAETGYALALAAAYSRGRLAIAYPIGRGVAPLLITAGGIVVLGQAPATTAALGAVLLLAGLALVAGAGGRAQLPAIRAAVVTGMAIAIYSTIDAAAVRHANPAAYLSIVMLISGLLLTARLRGDVARLRSAAHSGIAIGVGTVTAYLLVLVAFQLAPAGRVATIREASVLIAVLAARETRSRRVIGGAALVVAGVLFAGA